MLKKYKLTKTILLSIFSILIISCGAKKKVEVAKPKTQKQLNVISTGKLFQESLDLIKQQKYQEAITPLEKIITVEKKLPRVYFNLGLCYHRLNRFNKAYNFYITSLNLEPELINSLVNLVDIATPLKKEVKVLKRLDNFLSKKGNEFNVTILNAKAVLFSNQKKYKSASQSIRKALSRTPEDKKSLRNLSTIYYQQGKYVMAGTILGNLLGKHKELAKDSGLWNNLGMIQMKMGEKKKGLSNFRTAYELDPKNITTLKNLASFSLKYRDYKKSIERYNKVPRTKKQ